MKYHKEVDNFSVTKPDLISIHKELYVLRNQGYFKINENSENDFGSKTLAVFSLNYKITKRYTSYPVDESRATWCEPILSLCPVLFKNLKILHKTINFKRAILHWHIPGYIQPWHIDYTGADSMKRMLHFWLKKPKNSHSVWRENGIITQDTMQEGKVYFYEYGIEHMGYNFSNEDRHFVSLHLNN